MTNSFYMVLTSDARLEQFPENKAAVFKMQLPSQLHLSEDCRVAMTSIVYPHWWVNVRDNDLSYTLICKKRRAPRKLSIYLPSGIYCTVKDVIHGILSGLQNSLKDIYLNSDKTITSLGGNKCFYKHKKAQDYFELKLPCGWYVTLSMILARALGYLNLQANVLRIVVPGVYQVI